MPFDKDSGLVFKEATIRLPGCRHDVEHHSLYAKRRQQSRPDYGTSSLAKTAIHTLLKHLSNLEAAALRCLPEHIVENLWTAVARAGADSLHAWQLFAKTGYFGRQFVKTFSISCVQCSRRLLGLAGKAPLRSQSSWMTTLTLCDSPYDIAQLMGLAKLDGLQNLYIRSNRPPSQTHETTFSGRILRALAIEAKDYGALSQLETLFVDNPRDVALNTLQYLNNFPALNLFCARDCNFPKRKTLMSQIQGLGWHLDEEHDVAGLSYYYTTFQRSHDSKRPSWPTVVRTFLQHRRAQTSEINRPMLNVDIVPYCVSESYSSVSLDSTAFASRVVCFLRDQERASKSKTMPVPEPPAKRRKLNTKKLGAFDDLLHGLTC